MASPYTDPAQYERLYLLIESMASMNPAGTIRLWEVREAAHMGAGQINNYVCKMESIGWLRVTNKGQQAARSGGRLLMPIRQAPTPFTSIHEARGLDKQAQLYKAILDTWQFHPSQEDLASWVGLNRLTVRRLIHGWIRSGKLLAFKVCRTGVWYLFPPSAQKEFEEARAAGPVRIADAQMQIVERYLGEWLKSDLQVNHTRRSRAKVVRMIFRNVAQGAWDISETEILEYLGRRRQEGLSEKTIGAYLCALRSFFSFLQGERSQVARFLTIVNVRLFHWLRARRGDVATIKLKRQQYDNLKVMIRGEGAALKEKGQRLHAGL